MKEKYKQAWRDCKQSAWMISLLHKTSSGLWGSPEHRKLSGVFGQIAQKLLDPSSKDLNPTHAVDLVLRYAKGEDISREVLKAAASSNYHSDCINNSLTDFFTARTAAEYAALSTTYVYGVGGAKEEFANIVREAYPEPPEQIITEGIWNISPDGEVTISLKMPTGGPLLV